MKNNRRDFIKNSASMAAAISLGGITSAYPESAEKKKISSLAKLREYVKDAGIKFAFSMSPASPLVPFAKQLDVHYAVAGGELDPKAITATKEAFEKEGLKWITVEGQPKWLSKAQYGPGRDEAISNFITYMKNLKQYGGLDVLGYGWTPLGYMRTKNDLKGRGGALVTGFDYEDVRNMPLTENREVSKGALGKNLEYFLKAVVPEAEKIDIKLALHPSDPQVESIRGMSRIMTSVENFDRALNIVPSIYNGVNFCQGNFSLMGADIPALIRRWGKAGKIHFAHFRNVQDLSGVIPSTKFIETFHDEGQIDMYETMKAYYEIGFNGPMRPDHVPTMAGEENIRPGYMTLGNLFAIGYMRGLAESVAKEGMQAVPGSDSK